MQVKTTPQLAPDLTAVLASIREALAIKSEAECSYALMGDALIKDLRAHQALAASCLMEHGYNVKTQEVYSDEWNKVFVPFLTENRLSLSSPHAMETSLALLLYDMKNESAGELIRKWKALRMIVPLPQEYKALHDHFVSWNALFWFCKLAIYFLKATIRYCNQSFKKTIRGAIDNLAQTTCDQQRVVDSLCREFVFETWLLLLQDVIEESKDKDSDFLFVSVRELWVEQHSISLQEELRIIATSPANYQASQKIRNSLKREHGDIAAGLQEEGPIALFLSVEHQCIDHPLAFAFDRISVVRKAINRIERQLSQPIQGEEFTDSKIIQFQSPILSAGNPEFIKHEALKEEMDKLTARQKEIFVLYKGYELTQKQIAARLGISSETVNTHIDRAFKRLTGKEKPSREYRKNHNLPQRASRKKKK